MSTSLRNGLYSLLIAALTAMCAESAPADSDAGGVSRDFGTEGDTTSARDVPMTDTGSGDAASDSGEDGATDDLVQEDLDGDVALVDTSTDDAPGDTAIIQDIGPDDATSGDTAIDDAASGDTVSGDTASDDTAETDLADLAADASDLGEDSADTSVDTVDEPDAATGPIAPTGLQAATGAVNHSIDLSWNNAPAADSYKVYFDVNPITNIAGLESFTVTPTEGGATATTQSDLDLARTYYYAVTTVVGGLESAPTAADSAQPGFVFSGSATDFAVGERLAITEGRDFYLTWTDDRLIIGASADDFTSNRDTLFVAIDTGVADEGGGVRLDTTGENFIIWPFGADYIVALIPNSTNTVVNLLSWNGAGWDSAELSESVTPDRSWDGDVGEVWVSSAELGDPTHIRVAMAHVDMSNGWVVSVAPDNSASATDILGYFGSITGTVDIDDILFTTNPTTVQELVTDAPSLVRVQVDATGHGVTVGDVKLLSDFGPLSLDVTSNDYTLVDDQTRGDAESGDNIYSGRFNLGGESGELTFQFTSDGTAEFAGTDTERLFLLTGSEEEIPALEWGVKYIDANGMTLTFNLDFTGTQPDADSPQVRGEPTPLDWASGAMIDPDMDGVWTRTVTWDTWAPPDGVVDVQYKYWATFSAAEAWWPTGDNLRFVYDLVGPVGDAGSPQRGTYTLPTYEWNR